jgi:hypothetical protein
MSFSVTGNLMASYAALLKKGGGVTKKGWKEPLVESLLRELSTDHDTSNLQIQTRAMANRQYPRSPTSLFKGKKFKLIKSILRTPMRTIINPSIRPVKGSMVRILYM